MHILRRVRQKSFGLQGTVHRMRRKRELICPGHSFKGKITWNIVAWGKIPDLAAILAAKVLRIEEIERFNSANTSAQGARKIRNIIGNGVDGSQPRDYYTFIVMHDLF